MPRRTGLCIDDNPFQFKNKSLHIKKAYMFQDYQSSTVLTDDAFTYIDFSLEVTRKA